MNKDQLQQELQEKIKAGIKPSDLKKNKENIKPQPNISLHNLHTTSPSLNNRNNNSLPSIPSPNKLEQSEPKKVKELIKAVNFWQEAAQNYLQSLQKNMADLDQANLIIEALRTNKPAPINPELEKSLMEANQKIRELHSKYNDLASKNKQLIAKIMELEKQSKSQAKTNRKDQATQTLPTFFCDSCQLTKQAEYITMLEINDSFISYYCSCSQQLTHHLF